VPSLVASQRSIGKRLCRSSLTLPPGQQHRPVSSERRAFAAAAVVTDAHSRHRPRPTAPAGAACCQTGRQVRALAPEPPDASRPDAGAARLVTHCERTLRTDAPFAGAAAGTAAAGRGTPLSERHSQPTPRDLEVLAGWCAGPLQARVRAGPRAARGGTGGARGGRADGRVVVRRQRAGGQVLHQLLHHRHEARQRPLLLVLVRAAVLRAAPRGRARPGPRAGRGCAPGRHLCLEVASMLMSRPSAGSANTTQWVVACCCLYRAVRVPAQDMLH